MRGGDTTDAPASATGALGRAPTRADAVRRHRGTGVAHVVGELLLTAGAVLMLFVAYQLYWTGVETAQAQGDLKDELTAAWALPGADGPGAIAPSSAPSAGPSEGPSAEPSAEPGTDPGAGVAGPVELGEGLGILRIPRFGSDYAWVVVEGVRLDDLARGPGHYPGTALPGQVGNFAVAGHRATHGEPFAQVESLRVGDTVVVETAASWLTYSIFKISYPVPIDSTWALAPDPQNLGADPIRAVMTLTTCHPRWGSTYRFLVFAELVETLPKGAGVAPAALAEAT